MEQLTIDDNECQGTIVHSGKYELMSWSRVTYRVWKLGDIGAFPLSSVSKHAINAWKL